MNYALDLNMLTLSHERVRTQQVTPGWHPYEYKQVCSMP